MAVGKGLFGLAQNSPDSLGHNNIVGDKNHVPRLHVDAGGRIKQIESIEIRQKEYFSNLNLLHGLDDFPPPLYPNPFQVGAIPADGWSIEPHTWAFYNRTQAYTNDPAIGVSIVLNMINTADFIIGSDVTVSSSAGTENTYVTAVVLNTSITVNQLLLNHTTTSPLVTLLDVFTVNIDVSAIIGKGTLLKFTQTTVKYGTVYSSTFASGVTTIVMIHNTDYTLVNAEISNTYYSHIILPLGWPEWFNFDAAPLGYSALPTSTTYKYRPVGKSVSIIITQLVNGTSNATTLTTSAPMVSVSTTITTNGVTVDNSVISTVAARSHTLLNTRTITHRTDMNTGAWTAALGKRCNVLFALVEF